jgi:hypothetical protein
LSVRAIAFFTFGRKTIFRSGFSNKIHSINQQPFSASIAFLKIFFKAHIFNDERMELGGFVDAWNNFLTEYRTDVICSIGFAILFVYDISNILILHFVNLQVKYFTLGFR